MSWIIWPILIPLGSAPLAFLLPRWAPRIGMLTVFSLPFPLVFLLHRFIMEGGMQYPVGGWGAPLGIELRADGLSLFMLLMVTLVAVPTTIYARSYFPRTAEGRNTPDRMFWPLWLFLWAALGALFLAGDIFNLYVTLELLTLSAVALVALAGEEKALEGALQYLLTSLFGSLCYLLGVALLYGMHGTIDLALLGERVVPSPAAWGALALMSTGLVLKTALFPLHFWLPPAHASAPAPVSAVLSALVVKGSFYILLRLWTEVFPAVTTAGGALLLGILGSAAILWGSLQALRAERLKILVAYSTVAQVGYLFLYFPLAAQDGSGMAFAGVLLFALAHACGKAAMFLAAGIVLKATGSDRLEASAGRPPTMALITFALAGVSLVGLPPSAGFMGKWLLLQASLAQGQWWWTAVMAAGTLMAAGYLYRVLAPAFRASAGPPPRQASPLLQWSAFFLAAATLVLGLASAGLLGLIQETIPLPVQEVRS